MDMPRYKSHKIVRALKIKEVVDPTKPNDETDGSRLLFFEEEGYPMKRVDRHYVRKHEPKAGGYYVVYQDGYESWSPSEAFESGYEQI